MQFEDFALKTNARAFASRSKAKAKPQRDVFMPAHPQKLLLLEKELVPMLNQENIHPPIFQLENRA